MTTRTRRARVLACFCGFYGPLTRGAFVWAPFRTKPAFVGKAPPTCAAMSWWSFHLTKPETSRPKEGLLRPKAETSRPKGGLLSEAKPSRLIMVEHGVRA